MDALAGCRASAGMQQDRDAQFLGHREEPICAWRVQVFALDAGIGDDADEAVGAHCLRRFCQSAIVGERIAPCVGPKMFPAFPGADLRRDPRAALHCDAVDAVEDVEPQWPGKGLRAVSSTACLGRPNRRAEYSQAGGGVARPGAALGTAVSVTLGRANTERLRRLFVIATAFCAPYLRRHRPRNTRGRGVPRAAPCLKWTCHPR
jgi:hypothetical protein